MKIAIAVLVLLALFWAVTLWRAARNEATAIADHPPAGAFVTVDGHRIHYLVAGSGPDLVLIHGSSGNLNDYTFALIGALSDRYRVIAFDRPGLGYSDPPARGGASIHYQADLLARAADQLNVTAPIILGHSYGGAVALAWADLGRDDISALVLLAAASNPWTTGLGAYYTVLSSWWGRAIVIPILTAWTSEARVTAILSDIFAPQDMPPGYADHFGPDLSLRRSAMRENALQRANLLEEITEMTVRYPELLMPAEILHGDADPIVSARIHSEPLSRQMPNARLTLLPGAGHMPHHTHMPDVIAAIDRVAGRAGLR